MTIYPKTVNDRTPHSEETNTPLSIRKSLHLISFWISVVRLIAVLCLHGHCSQCFKPLHKHCSPFQKCSVENTRLFYTTSSLHKSAPRSSNWPEVTWTQWTETEPIAVMWQRRAWCGFNIIWDCFTSKLMSMSSHSYNMWTVYVTADTPSFYSDL